MVETHINLERLLIYEPSIIDFQREDEIDAESVVSEIIQSCKDKLISDIKKRGHDIRRLCKRLYLQASVTKTEAYTGVESDEDYAERLRWVVKVTSITGAVIFYLEGRNSSSDSYTSLANTVVNKNGTYTLLVNTEDHDPYKFYRVRIGGDFTTVTYESYMVESSFEMAHIYLSLWGFYNRIRYRISSDVFGQKANEYLKLYEYELDTLRYYYDRNDDGDISSSENFIVPFVTVSR